MGVTFKRSPPYTYTVEDVIRGREALIKAIIESVLVDQTDSYIDMLADDTSGREVTRSMMNEDLRRIKETAGQYLDDWIIDFGAAIKERLAEAQYGAAVTCIKYDLAGQVTDADIDVSITYNK